MMARTLSGSLTGRAAQIDRLDRMVDDLDRQLAAITGEKQAPRTYLIGLTIELRRLMGDDAYLAWVREWWGKGMSEGMTAAAEAKLGELNAWIAIANENRIEDEAEYEQRMADDAELDMAASRSMFYDEEGTLHSKGEEWAADAAQFMRED